MAVLADDDVVVNRYAERLCRIDNHFRHVDIGARRRRVAGGMVVDQPMNLIKYIYFSILYPVCDEVVPVFGSCIEERFLKILARPAQSR